MRQAVRRGIEVGFHLGVLWGIWTSYQLLEGLAPTRCLTGGAAGFFLVSLATSLFSLGLLIPACLATAIAAWATGRLLFKRATDPLAACVAIGVAILALLTLLSYLRVGTFSLRSLIPLAGLALATALSSAGAACLTHMASRSAKRETIFALFSSLLFSLFATFPVAAWGITRVLSGSKLSRTDRLGFMVLFGAGLLVLWGLLWLAIRVRSGIGTVLAWLIALACVVGTAGTYIRGTGPTDLPQSAVSADRPNVVLVVIDSLRADAIGTYGGSARTPNLDRLAQESVVFENAFSVAPWTSPSMASLFTSLYPSVHGAGVHAIYLDEGLPTLAEKFQQSRYCTTAVLNQHLFVLPSGFDRGLDSVYSVECWLPSVLAETAAGALVTDLLGLDSFQITSTERVAKASIRALSEVAEPFFLWAHWYDPHSPYTPPAAFEPEETSRRLFQGARGWTRLREIATQDLSGGFFFDSQDLVDVVGALYRAEVEFVDQEVGRLLDALKESDLEDNTILVVTADHGEELWDHQKWDHGQSLHQELLHVPLMMRIPGVEPSRIPVRVRSIDLYPTLLDMAGIDYDPGTIQGQSLVPVIRGDEDANRTLIAESCLYYQEQQALYQNGFKAIWYTYRLAPQLYDLTGDPRETHDLASERPEQLATMRRTFDGQFSGNQVLRKRLLGKDSRETDPASPETIEQLKTLGYVN